MGDKQKHLACLLTVKAVPDPLVIIIILLIVIIANVVIIITTNVTITKYLISWIYTLYHHNIINISALEFSPQNPSPYIYFIAKCQCFTICFNQTLEITDQLDALAWEWCNSLVKIVTIIIITTFYQWKKNY